MKLSTLSDPILLLEQHMTLSGSILRESCSGLTIEQRTVVEGIYTELRPLIEASLTAQQIQSLFGEIEKTATAGGGNRTLIGKGVDVARAADETVNKIGRWLQDTTPVKNFDQKFENLKNAINKKFPDSKILDAISEMGMWAERNPGKTAAIVGVLTAIAGLAGGPIGGAIAGQILRGSVELLKGEKLSTAIGKGIKTAAYGFIAGKTFELIGDALSSGAQLVKDTMFPGAVRLNMTQIFNEVGGEMGSRYAAFEVKGLIIKPEDAADVKTLFNDAASAWKAGDYDQSAKVWSALNDYIEGTLKSPEYVAQIAADADKRQIITQAASAAQQVFKFLGAAAQGAVAAGGVKGSLDKGKKESYYLQTRPLSEGQVYLLFKRIDEGAMDWIKTKAGNLANKITVDKLNTAWNNAGNPTDADDLYNVLTGAGNVPDDIVAQAYKSMKIPYTGAPGEPPADGGAPADIKTVIQMVEKLPKSRKQRLLKYMEKQLGVA